MLELKSHLLMLTNKELEKGRSFTNKMENNCIMYTILFKRRYTFSCFICSCFNFEICLLC